MLGGRISDIMLIIFKNKDWLLFVKMIKQKEREMRGYYYGNACIGK